MKKSGFYLFGKPLRDAHLARLFQRVVKSPCQERIHHEAMKKSGFYLFGRTLRDAHLAKALPKNLEPALLHGFMVYPDLGKRFLLSAHLAYLFGKPLRDAHLAKLFQRVWNPLFFMASWCIPILASAFHSVLISLT